MSILRKIALAGDKELERDTWQKHAVFVPDEPTIDPKEFHPLLLRLLRAPTLDDPDAQAVVSRIREIASTCGTFLTASEIQRCLNSYDFNGEEGEPLECGKAYELAAKLHWEHLHKQIEAIESKSRELGPTVFASFVEELIECLYRIGHPSKFVEIPVALADELLQKALALNGNAENYAVLAHRSVSTALDLCKDWLEATESDAARHWMEDVLVPYLEELDTAYETIITELTEVAMQDKTRELLARLFGSADRAGYLPYRAMVLEQVAALAQQYDPDEAATALEKAADDWEQQGTAEKERKLVVLCSKRQKRAHVLRSRAESETDLAAS